MNGEAEPHTRLADRVREKVGAAGVTDPRIRLAAMNRGGDGPTMDEPYDSLAHQIGDASFLVTDEQVAAVRQATGSDKGAFEVILSASIGAGLARWDAAMQAIEGAADATE
jgi:hypothetical protein